jgi:hypothetical protein
MNIIKRILQRPLNDPMRFIDRAQCFLFFLTCLGPAVRAGFKLFIRLLPPATFTPMGFKFANEERSRAYYSKNWKTGVYIS